MKKTASLFSVLLLLLLCFSMTSCKIKEYTPELPCVFTQNGEVTSGDFSYECKICKNEDGTVVTVLDTNAKGLKMSYDGEKINFDYGGFSYDIAAKELENGNAAVIIYNVFSSLESDDAAIRKIDGGYKYEGSCSAGDYVIIQNDDNSLKSMSLKSGDFSVTFM